MKNSIRFKYTLGLTIIYVFSSIILNILIRQVFDSNLENIIKNSMKDVMENTSEYIEYNSAANESYINEKSFYKDTWNLLYNSMLSNNFQYEIRDDKGKVVEGGINEQYNALGDKGTKSALSNKAVVNIQYSTDNAEGVLSYPIYHKDRLLGVLNVSKSYADFYLNNTRLINIITLIEMGVFVLIFMVSYLFMSKITSPLIKLTKEIKKIEDGNYETNLNTGRRDEIGVLLNEFLRMKDRIKEQICTINNEKDKVLKLEAGRRDFFNNVTHELKTPLTAISGYSQMLLDGNVEDEDFKHRAVERINLESERLKRLVLDLIHVSKGAVFIEEERKTIDMQKIILEICEDIKIKAEKYSISISKSIESGLIKGQENKIRQLLINILDNAVKYSYNGEEILIKTYCEKNFYILEVINCGGPISEEVYKNIFSPFVKGENSNETGSRGLGLYICSEIVKEHNGEIYIKNSEDVKVVIKLPIYDSYKF